MHHREVVNVHVQHRLQILTGRLIVALKRETSRSRDHKTDIEVCDLVFDAVEVVRGQGLLVGEVDLNDSGLRLRTSFLEIGLNVGEFGGVTGDQHHVKAARRDLTRVFRAHAVGRSNDERPGTFRLVPSQIFALQLLEGRHGVLEDKADDLSEDQQQLQSAEHKQRGFKHQNF